MKLQCSVAQAYTYFRNDFFFFSLDILMLTVFSVTSHSSLHHSYGHDIDNSKSFIYHDLSSF